MIDFEKQRAAIVKGLSKYLNCPVIRSNQNAPLPDYPFVSYTITTLMSENKGTYGEYTDGKARKAVTQTWSISALSNDNFESVTLANKAREWLDYFGKTYLDDNNVIIQSVGSVTNRDNVLTVEYEYKNGFDMVIWLYDEITLDPNVSGWIESTEINQIEIQGESYEDMILRLTKRLRGDL